MLTQIDEATELGERGRNAARHFSPIGHARFLQADPAGYDDGPNLYGYTQADPINQSDPNGECARQVGADGAETFVGICGTSTEAAQFIQGRIDDPNSSIGEVEAMAVEQGQRVEFRLNSTDRIGEDPVDGARTESGILRHGKLFVAVTIDPNDQPLVRGIDVVSGDRINDYAESMEETAEHEIGGYVRDRLTGGAFGNEAGAIARENVYRERIGNPFRRTDEYGRIVPRNPR